MDAQTRRLAYPDLAPIAASWQRWKHAQFRGSFGTYTGVDQLVRNFNKSPHKWGLTGDKSYRYLREHLWAKEADFHWSRAVSSDGQVEGDPLSGEVLVEFGKTAAALLKQPDARVMHAGLTLLAAVSSDNPTGIAVAKALLGANKPSSSSLITAALEVAGYCFQKAGDVEVLYARIDRGLDRDSAHALARIAAMREDALHRVDLPRLSQWATHLSRLLRVRDRGLAPTMTMRTATEALAALLRARKSHPGFLLPDSKDGAQLCATIRQLHSDLCSEDAHAHATTCAGLRRLLRYVEGKGQGPVLLEVMSKDSEPPLPSTQAATPAPAEIAPRPTAVATQNTAPRFRPTRAGQPMQPDPAQTAVIEADPTSFQLVIAPPGAGKTAVACARVAWLAKNNVQPAAMLMISFTRVAVAEFRNRVKKLAPEVPEIHGVEVSTLDSLAYRILWGLDEDPEQAPLLGDFDQNIANATAKIEAGDNAISDWIRRYQHILIDEAQDLVGPRASMVTAILRCRSESCGATVFGDPAQAIYGFTTDEDEDGEATSSFFDALAEAGLKPETRELTEIHRTDNPRLQKLFLEGRRPIAGRTEHPREAWARARNVIEQCADEDIGGFDDLMKTSLERDALVLFRTRAQVLMASSLLHTDGVAHRIRMSGTPMVIEPWIGFLLRDFGKSLLLRSDLESRWEAAAGHACILANGRSLESAWAALREIAPGTRQGVDMPTLRQLLSRSRPPIQVATTELGTQGPILGTVHASKGREASEVIFMLPPEKAARADSDFLEEGRVLYVGATRVVDRLRIGAAAACHAGSLDSGRVYRNLGQSRAQVEVGRDGDVDLVGTVSQDLHEDDACNALQDWLADHAAGGVPVVGQEPTSVGVYRLKAPNGAGCIGRFTQGFHREMLSVAAHCDLRRHKLPPEIRYLHMVGVTTVALEADDPRIGLLHEPYASSGLFLAPVIRGFTTVPFFSSFSTHIEDKTKW